MGTESLEAGLQSVSSAEVGDPSWVEGESGPGGSAALVEDGGGLGLGVVLEELVDFGEEFGGGSALFPGGGIGLDSEGSCGAAAESEAEGEIAVAGDGDVLDEEASHAGALAVGSLGVVPEFREVGGEGEDGLALGGVELGLVGGAAAFEVLEGCLLLGEPGVPVGFELRGDEAVVRVDAEEASAGEFGLLGGALGVAFAERVGFVGAGGEFVLDAEGGFEAEGGDEFDEESADGLIDGGSGDGLTGRGGGFGAAAEVAGEALVAAGVVSPRSCGGRSGHTRRAPGGVRAPRAGGLGGRSGRRRRPPQVVAGWLRTASRRGSRGGRRGAGPPSRRGAVGGRRPFRRGGGGGGCGRS